MFKGASVIFTVFVCRLSYALTVVATSCVKSSLFYRDLHLYCRLQLIHNIGVRLSHKLNTIL